MVALGELTVRQMHAGELPAALASCPRRPAGQAGDLCQASHTREHVGWVAEVRRRRAGSAVCALVRHKAAAPGETPHPRLARLASFFGNLLGRAKELPLWVELLGLTVEFEPSRPRVERALLERLLKELESLWSRAPVMVPESSLSAQLTLRKARYKAVRVLHGYFGDEDGYLMTDEFTVPACTPDLTAEHARGQSPVPGP